MHRQWRIYGGEGAPGVLDPFQIKKLNKYYKRIVVTKKCEGT